MPVQFWPGKLTSHKVDREIILNWISCMEREFITWTWLELAQYHMHLQNLVLTVGRLLCSSAREFVI